MVVLRQWMLTICAACSWLAIASGGAQAQDRSLASLVPESTVIYLEAAPADRWLDHPLRRAIAGSQSLAALAENPDAANVRAAIAMAELALGDTLENIARQLAHGGFSIAVDAQQNAAALVSHSTSQLWLEAYLKRVAKVVRDQALAKGEPDPIKRAEYRGRTIYRTDQGLAGAFDGYLLIANNQELARSIADRILDRQGGGLAASPAIMAASEAWASAASQHAGSEQVAWSFVNVQVLRDAGVAKEFLKGRANDFAAEMILGGVLAALHHTPTLTASLIASDKTAELTITAPTQPQHAGDNRAYLFGPNGKGEALPLLQVDQTLASVSAYRDLSQLWLRAGDLFNERVNDQLAQADSSLTTLFSGRDFGLDILGALHPELRMVVARQNFADGQAKPAIVLPTFALVAQLRDPELMSRELKRIFQSLVGFFNIVGAMNGQPQLDLDSHSEDGHSFFTATFVRDVDRHRDGSLPVAFNFSPTIAFVGDAVVVASTTALARSLATQIGGPDAAERPADADAVGTGLNTLVQVNGPALHQALVDNRDYLIAQNMLEKGTTKQEAEAQVQVFLSILRAFEQLRVQLGFADAARFRVAVDIASNGQQ
jgi:hypothetical protein